MSGTRDMLAGIVPGGDTSAAHAAPGFDHVREWVFDLDNTLYCASYHLFDQIDKRMGEYLMRLFNVDIATARHIQKDYYYRYGTTLHGLLKNNEIADPDDYLAFVHDIDYSHIEPDPALDVALARLEGRKWVFTNGSLSHAEAVLNRLGVLSHIDEIFDVKAAGYVPKPAREAFDAFFRRTGIAPRSSAMFEDIARNLEEPHARGMVTVWVDHPENTDAKHVYACIRQPEKGWDEKPPHVHYRTEHLTTFLNEITRNATANETENGSSKNGKMA